MTADESETGTGRRVDLALERAFGLGPLQVRPAIREVQSGERRELLEPRIMQVLVCLNRSAGQVVTRDELIECCWDGRIVGEDAINRVIARLRRLSEADEGGAFTIETIPRVGYRLWPTQTEPEAPAEAETVAEAEPPAPPPAEHPQGEAARRPRRRWRIAIGAAVLTLAGTAVVYASGGLLKGAPEATVAVLPFRDLSPASNQGYFAEGVAEDIQTALAADAGLTVIGRTSARRFRDDPDLETMRRALGVSHVLEGSVQTRGAELRMNVRLIRTSDGAQVWAQTYRRPTEDVFAAQDEISAGVARALRSRFVFGGDRPGVAERAEPEAYSLVLAARERLRQGRDFDVAAALSLARRATDADPDYGPAWAGLALATLAAADRVDGGGRLPLKQAQADARRYAERAVSLAPDNAASHAALARTGSGEAALTSAERAVELDPSNGESRVLLADLLLEDGRPLDAKAQLQAAVERDPLYPGGHLRLAHLDALIGRHGEAVQAAARFERLIGRPGESAMARAYLAGERADWSEMVLEAERAHKLDPSYFRGEMLARGYGVLGLYERAAGLQSLTKQPFEAAFYAADDSRALRELRRLGPAVWEEPIRRWMAADLLTRHGRGAELLNVLAERYGGAADYCRRGEYDISTDLALALQKAGRAADAETVLGCTRERIQRQWASGVQKGANSFSLAEIAAVAGRKAEALDLLDRSFAEGYRGEFSADVARWPALTSLKTDPRFERQRARLLAWAERERSEFERASAQSGSRSNSQAG